MSRLFLAAFAAMTGVAACSLFVDTDGLAGGPRDGSDGGMDGARADVDVPRDDSSAPIDAGFDGRFCERFGANALFCDDFDDPNRTDPKIGWTVDNVDKGGTLSIVPARPGSNALQVIWDANVGEPAGDCNYARLMKEIPVAVSRFTFGFDIFLGDEKGGAFYDDAVTNFVWRPTATSKFCQLYLIGLRSSPGLNDGSNERPLKSIMSVGVWHRVEISLDGVAQPASVAIQIDGENAFRKPESLPSGCEGPMKVNLQHGLFCAQKNPGVARVLYDNVTFVGE